MANLLLHRPYSISPSPKAYEIITDQYLSQRAEFTGIVGAAIIIHDNRVLLLQRASEDDCPDLWEVPGGGANCDETPVQCAVRELREEAGLAASAVVDMIGEFEWIEPNPSAKDHGQTAAWKIFMFLVSVESHDGDLQVRIDQQEHQAYLWASKADIQEDSCDGVPLQWISSNQRDAILAAFDINQS